MNLNLDWSFFSWDLFSNFVLKGLYFSVSLTVIATLGGIFFGTLLALMRLSGKKWLVVPATIYVNGMRSIPLVMVILWFFLLVPLIIGRPIGAESSAVITFVAFEAAYFSEIMRAGIQSIPRGQVFAGQALGMTYGQNMKLVILPQAFRNMLPVLLTQTIILFQDTSLVYAIGAYDLLKGFETAGKNFGRYLDVDGDGIPYRTIPGTHPTKGAFFSRGTTRNAYAKYSETGADYVYNMERLRRKFETAKTLVPAPILTAAAKSTRYGVLYYGSTSPAMAEAFALLAKDGVQVDMMRVRGFPFAAEIEDFVANHDVVYVVEQNESGQLRMLLINECEIDPKRLVRVLHYDGTPITARFITGRASALPVLQSLGSAPVLTVGESDGFASAGGVIGLYMEGDKVRFEANPDAAQRAGLKLSSQILRLARLVRDGKGGR